MCNKEVMVLELNELIKYDNSMQNIVVDKNIFDCFVENSYIDIQFAEDSHNLIYTYKMVAEDNEAIYMELME